MKVKGVRLYGVKDIRLEEFEIPEIAEDEILLNDRNKRKTNICLQSETVILNGCLFLF